MDKLQKNSKINILDGLFYIVMITALYNTLNLFIFKVSVFSSAAHFLFLGIALLLSCALFANKKSCLITVGVIAVYALIVLFEVPVLYKYLGEWLGEVFSWLGSNQVNIDTLAVDNETAYGFFSFLLCLVSALISHLLVIKLKFGALYISVLAILFSEIIFVSVVGRDENSQFLIMLFAFMLGGIFLVSRKVRERVTVSLSSKRFFTLLWQQMCVFFLVISLLMTWAILPRKFGYQYKPAAESLETFIKTMEKRFSDKARGKDFVLDIADAGFANNSDATLGGDVNPRNEEDFKIINTDQVYLRGSVYTYYTGKAWLKIEPEIYYYNHNDRNRQIFAETFGQYEGFYDLNKDTEMYNKRTFSITDSSVKTSSVFSAIVPTDIRMENSQKKQIRFDTSSEIFSRDTQFRKYEVDYLEINRNHPKVKEYLRVCTVQDIDGDYSQYLQLPSNMPVRMSELAAKLTKDTDNVYDAASEIEKYLKSNYTYTLTPGDVPEGREFVDYFLFEGKSGYCTYYATAFVAMCRAVGIPARYVVGYRVDSVSTKNADGELEAQSVYGTNAHAWAEVYIPTVGWLTFDPVGSDDFNGNIQGEIGEDGEDVQPEPTPTPTPEPTPTPTPEPMETPTITPSVTPEIGVTPEPTHSIGDTEDEKADEQSIHKLKNKANIKLILLIVLIPLLLILLCLLWVLMKRKFDKYEKNVCTYSARKHRQRLLAYDVILLLKRVGVKRENDETIAVFISKSVDKLHQLLSKKNYISKEQIAEDAVVIVQLMDKSLYSETIIDSDSYEMLVGFRMMAAEAVRIRFGKVLFMLMHTVDIFSVKNMRRLMRKI